MKNFSKYKPRLAISIGLAFLVISCTAQTDNGRWVGEALYRSAWEYARLDCDSIGCTFKLPYVDGRVGFAVAGRPLQEKNWSVLRRAEHWQFDTRAEENSISGSLLLNGQQQPILLHRQLAVDKDKVQEYTGYYRDENGQVSWIYENFGGLIIQSPYSEEITALKPIGEHQFWTAAGEYFSFEGYSDGRFQRFVHQDREGQDATGQRFDAFELEEVWIPSGADTLFGLFYRPPGDRPAPAVLLLQGGGNAGLDNYKMEAEFYASHGMAVLLCDKSGVGRSKGTGHFWSMSFDEKRQQYRDLFLWLRRQPSTDPGRVGVHGPSEGGRLALMMAGTMGDTLAFVNVVAAPVMTFKEIQLYAMDHYHRNLGISEERNLTIRHIWNQYYDQLAAGKIDTAVIAAANTIRGDDERYFLPPAATTLPASPLGVDVFSNTADYIAAIRCPVLLQYGENDERVDKAASLRNYFEQCKTPQNTTVIIYPRGNHSCMTPEQKICTGLFTDKWHWLQEVVKISIKD